MADDHTREHFLWLRQVADDPDVIPAGFKLAFILGEHFNRETGTAWPSQATLARLIGVKDRQVRNLLRVLVDRGHVEVSGHRGPRAANLYRAKRKHNAGSHGENRQSVAGSDQGEAAIDFRISDEKRQSSAREPAIQRTRCGNGLPTNYLEQLQTLERGERRRWFKENQPSFTCYLTDIDDRFRSWCQYLGVASLPTDKRGGWNFPAPTPPDEVEHA